MMGLVVAADASGRLPVLNAAALGAGGALGPGLVGMLSEDGSFTAAFLLIGSVALVSAGLAVAIGRAVRARRARA